MKWQARAFEIPTEARNGYAEQLPADAGEFDVTISRLAPHRFSDIKTALGEFYRITKPGGLIGIIDLQGNDTPRFDTLLHVLEMLHDPTHVRSDTASYWRGLIQNGGFEIVTMETGLSEKPG